MSKNVHVTHEAKAIRGAFGLIAEALDQRDVILAETDDAVLAAMLLDVVEGLNRAAAALTPLARRAASKAVSSERIARAAEKALREDA